MAQKSGVYELKVFNKMKNKNEQVPSAALAQYYSDLGMSEEWVTKAMKNIDQDNYLSRMEFGSKIKLINQLCKANESDSKNRKLIELQCDNEYDSCDEEESHVKYMIFCKL